MSLSKREIILLGLLIVAAGIYLGYHFVLEPISTKTSQLKAENSTLSTDWQTFQQRMDQQGDLGLEEKKIRTSYEQMLAKVPQNPMIPEAIDFMQVCAQEANVKLLTINYKENSNTKPATDGQSPPVSSAAQPTSFQITASGSHFNLLSFLLKMENASRIFIISSAQLNLVKKEVAQDSTIATTSEPNAANVGPGKNVELVVKQSETYDKNKSVLDLSFTAYYDSSSLLPPNPAVVPTSAAAGHL